MVPPDRSVFGIPGVNVIISAGGALLPTVRQIYS